MSDYTQSTNFTAKDALPTGNPSKTVTGVDFDLEFGNIETAIATKVDAVGTGLSLASKTISLNITALTNVTPAATDEFLLYDASGAAHAVSTFSALEGALALTNLSDYGGILQDVNELVDPNADRIMFWDDSAGLVTWMTVSTGLTLSGTTLTTNDSAIVHDSLSGFVSDEHVAHSGVTLTAGTGLSGGGTIAASRTFNLDISGLTSMTVAPDGADSFLYNDGGTMKQMTWEQVALPSNDVSVSRNFASSDVGHVVRVTSGTVTLTMPSGVGQDEAWIIVINSTANDVTLANGTATIDSANSLKTIPAGGMATLIRESSTLWHAGGSLQ